MIVNPVVAWWVFSKISWKQLFQCLSVFQTSKIERFEYVMVLQWYVLEALQWMDCLALPLFFSFSTSHWHRTRDAFKVDRPYIANTPAQCASGLKNPSSFGKKQLSMFHLTFDWKHPPFSDVFFLHLTPSLLESQPSDSHTPACQTLLFRPQGCLVLMMVQRTAGMNGEWKCQTGRCASCCSKLPCL